MIIMSIILVVLSIILLSSVLYIVTDGKLFHTIYHDIFKWHIPKDDEQATFDGCTLHSHCKLCDKEIMSDSQDNWF